MARGRLVWFQSARGVAVVAIQLVPFVGPRAMSVAMLAESPLPVWLVLPALLLFCGAIVGVVVWQAGHRARPATAHDARPLRGHERSTPSRRATGDSSGTGSENHDFTMHDAASYEPPGEHRRSRASDFDSPATGTPPEP